MKDLTSMLMDYEGGQLDESETVELFQHLIDTGMAWRLQGHYGRTAKALIEAGYCTAPQLRKDAPLTPFFIQKPRRV